MILLSTFMYNNENFEEALMSRNLLMNVWDLEHVISALKDKLIAYHVHNNNGDDDQHKRIHDGTLNFKISKNS